MGTNGHSTNGNGHADGGLGGGSVDLSRGKDREYLRRGIASGWGLTPETLIKYREALDTALDIALAEKNARAITSCTRTLATLVGQVQAEEDATMGSDPTIVVQFDRPD